MARARRSAVSARGVVLDAGAFIALERGAGHVTKLLARLVRANTPLVTSGGVVAQIWRGGAGRQAPVAMLLSRIEVVAIDRIEGRLVGMMLGACGATDPVDGHVALLASERRWPVLTSDARDLLTIDPGLEIISV